MFVVGAEPPFPGSFFEGCKNEYKDSTLLMSLVDSKNVNFFSDVSEALAFAGYEMLVRHSSPKTTLPLGMRAVFEVSGEEETEGMFCVKKIERVCFPFDASLGRDVYYNRPEDFYKDYTIYWKELSFDVSKSVYENEYTFESYVNPVFYPDRIHLTTSTDSITVTL